MKIRSKEFHNIANNVVETNKTLKSVVVALEATKDNLQVETELSQANDLGSEIWEVIVLAERLKVLWEGKTTKS